MNASIRAAYIHVPFCARRCPYCNFTVVAGRDDLMDAYLEAIGRELASLRTPRPIDTLFFGGGTPTQLPPAKLARLIRLVRRYLKPAEGCEWTVEANPNDLRPETIDVLTEAGVNRLSLGVQSFDADKLRTLGRTHRPDDALRAIEDVRGHFASIALDMIFGVPGETLDVWRSDLARAAGSNVHHLSTYGLTFEKGAAFWSQRAKGRLRQVDEPVEAAMYETAIDTLLAAGWEHYEVSNFARPGHRCRHNDAYWSGRPYYAFGPGAARYVDGRRETNHRSTTAYVKRMAAGQSPVAQSETLSSEDRARERLVFGLRRIEGVSGRWFRESTGRDMLGLTGRTIEKYEKLGLFEWDDGTLRLTRRGLMVSDAIWPDLLGGG